MWFCLQSSNILGFIRFSCHILYFFNHGQWVEFFHRSLAFKLTHSKYVLQHCSRIQLCEDSPMAWTDRNFSVACIVKHELPSYLWLINSLAPGKFEWNFRHVIFKQILVIDDWGISCEIALIWMSLDFTDDQSTLVQAMAWCRQATIHYMSQWWPSSLSPYSVLGHNELTRELNKMVVQRLFS